MVTTDDRPDSGGNTQQFDDGRDEDGRLPEPLDAAHYPPTDDGPAVAVPGMPLSQVAGTGPVVSTPAEPTPRDNVTAEPEPEAEAEAEPKPAKKAAKGGMTTMPRAGD